jgi:tetratricopeptide (TPR) repeat protein
MALHEAIPADFTFSVLAMDMNRIYLKKAAEGIYSARSVRQVPPQWLHKYFETSERGRFILKEEIKKHVTFRRFNIVKGIALISEPPPDILFCRNVLIYFPLEITKNVIKQFEICLQKGAFLFLGEAECLWQISEVFQALDLSNAIIYRKELHPETGNPPPIAFPALVTMTEPSPEKAAPIQTPAETDAHGGTSALIAKASLLADQGQLQQAVEVLLQIIRLDNLSTEAYYLLGILYQKQRSFEESLKAFRKALYADPSLALVYFHLANIYQYKKLYAEAARELQNAAKELNGKSDEELVRFSNEIECGYLRAVCQRELERVSELIGRGHK